MDSIVVDVGGTSLRIGYFDAGGLVGVRRCPVENFKVNEGISSAELYERFVAQLCGGLQDFLTAYPAAPIGLSFPGPIDGAGRVVSAPTLWGAALRDVDLADDLRRRLGRSIVMLNDISAAVWRYAAPDSDDFCLITISSGIGNKVYRGGEILLNSRGLGGEIGHCRVGYGDFALPCDCGGTGHLGALASGRGTLQLSYMLALRDPGAVAESPLGRRWGKNTSPQWTTADLVSAIHSADPFAMNVLSTAQSFLVSAMSHLYHWIGVQRFIFIGGFATAIGAPYIDNLNHLLARESWFGIEPDAMGALCSAGAPDDDHGLIGVGRHVAMMGESQ